MTFKELLSKNNLSIYKLSKDSGIAKSTLIDIASGKSNILDCRGRILQKLAISFNVSIETILSLEQEPYIYTYETNLPKFLMHSITNLKKGLRTNSSILDCYLDETNSSINVAEVEHLITKEQANYLRRKYLY